ncbi:MAG: hypothetical protein ACAI18_05045 [Gemmatimonadales bacterium]
MTPEQRGTSPRWEYTLFASVNMMVMPMPETPELLYLLAGDPAEFAQVVAGIQPVDAGETLRGLPSQAAARVVTALPFDLAVQVLDE